jgi:acylphosphatase
MQKTALHLTIAGRVQGVGYRQNMCRVATGLGVSGWVRNRRDGTVEAVLQGNAAACESLAEWARHGPPAAVVSRIDARPPTTEELQQVGGGSVFTTLPTV